MSSDDIKKMLKARNAMLSAGKEKAADIVESQIMDEFRRSLKKYDVDFVIETLTKLGGAPNVIYDDNGMFAVTADGYTPAVCGKQRIEGAFSLVVKKEQWFGTIRKALQHYINDKEE